MTREQKHKRAVAAIFAGVVLLSVLLIIFTFDEQKNIVKIFTGKKNIDSEAVDLINGNISAISKAMDASAFKQVALIDKNDHFEGDLTSALIHLIVYNDYSSEFGNIFDKSLNQAKEEYAEFLAIAYRHFPLSGNGNSLMASLAVECAGEQGKFIKMHEAVLSASDNEDIIFGKEEVMNIAGELNLNNEEFSKCLENQTYIDKIQRDINGAKEAGVAGTPAIFINGSAYAGAMPFEDFTDSSGEERLGLRSLIQHHLEIMDNTGENELTEEK
jgi:protein-disulfide isomerase